MASSSGVTSVERDRLLGIDDLSLDLRLIAGRGWSLVGAGSVVVAVGASSGGVAVSWGRVVRRSRVAGIAMTGVSVATGRVARAGRVARSSIATTGISTAGSSITTASVARSGTIARVVVVSVVVAHFFLNVSSFCLRMKWLFVNFNYL